ncbi:hypothetical protein [Sphaerisporangium fuscum]|uniref:hypothetical protein n=1 Tax=Sphaerisporangium fuscum TaxID=2835868 RepID=UPI001BDCCF80|nr:hypothetical protein [Sphaerisporangium fuscum]
MSNTTNITVPAGPLEAAPWGIRLPGLDSIASARAIWRHALRGLPLGAHDQQMADWAEHLMDQPTLISFASLLERARAAAPDEPATVHRIPGPHGHTFVIHGTREQADAYVRWYRADPDTYGEDGQDDDVVELAEVAAYALVSRCRLAEAHPSGGFGIRVETDLIAVHLDSRPLMEQAEREERRRHPGVGVDFAWYPTGVADDAPQELYITLDGEEETTGYLLTQITVRMGGTR